MDDREPLTRESFIKNIHGKLCGDKGYISQKLFDHLFVNGIQLITKMSVADKVLIFQELSEQAELYERINRRVDVMIENGFLEEAETLYEFRDRPALKTVGYKELFDYLDGKHSLDKAVELIKRNTRRYAKRQITWWRRS